MKIRGFIRSKIWDEYMELDRKVMFLKAIVQNDVELTDEDLEDHERLTRRVIEKLITLNDIVKSEALKSNKE